MKHQWLSRSGTASLILLFGGWALGATPFRHLKCKTDVLLAHDYRTLDDPLTVLSEYDQVDLVAFSFGVASAVHWLSVAGVRPARLTAISGTLSPADADRGIAPNVVRATADKLDDNSFARFCRRAGLNAAPPTIDIASAQSELHAVINRGPAPQWEFDRIWIPDRDRIIPVKAQETAWVRQEQNIRRCSGPHIPFGPGQSWAEWMA